MNGVGGSYRIEKGGKVKLLEQTQPHPDGNRPRAADGTPLDLPETTPATPATAAAPAAPKE